MTASAPATARGLLHPVVLPVSWGEGVLHAGVVRHGRQAGLRELCTCWHWPLLGGGGGCRYECAAGACVPRGHGSPSGLQQHASAAVPHAHTLLTPGHRVVAGALYKAAAASRRALPALLCDTRHTAAIWPGVTGQLRPGWCACVCQWEGSETGVLGGESRTIKHARVLPRGRGGPLSPPCGVPCMVWRVCCRYGLQHCLGCVPAVVGCTPTRQTP
jgi:hypothetical protein